MISIVTLLLVLQREKSEDQEYIVQFKELKKITRFKILTSILTNSIERR
jgi:hypothetical protein